MEGLTIFWEGKIQNSKMLVLPEIIYKFSIIPVKILIG